MRSAAVHGRHAHIRAYPAPRPRLSTVDKIRVDKTRGEETRKENNRQQPLTRARDSSAATLRQLEAIEGATLSAPPGQHDDRAISFLLALAALRQGCYTGPAAIIPPEDVIALADRTPFR